MRKIKKLWEKIEKMKSPVVGEGNDYYSGYNKAINNVLALLKRKEKKCSE